MNDEKPTAFERANHTPQTGVLMEFVHFLKHNRKYWLIPLLLALFALGALIILGSTAAAPFIYTLF